MKYVYIFMTRTTEWAYVSDENNTLLYIIMDNIL